MSSFEKETTKNNQPNALDDLATPQIEKSQASLKNFLEQKIGQSVQIETKKHIFNGNLKEVLGSPENPTLVMTDKNNDVCIVNFNHIESLKLPIPEQLITTIEPVRTVPPPSFDRIVPPPSFDEN